MAAVKQDIFDDLDEEARQRAVLDAKRSELSAEDEKRAMKAAVAHATGSSASERACKNVVSVPAGLESDSSRTPTPDATTPKTGGVLSSLTGLIWGAPKTESSEDKSKSL
ncbi:hypothetical protein K438DRAFT_345556 [Mycena galopus ATCC 62051]|nr:hypothetical protein K438DRAFT_345556 [Mycena galopus ATCC 62051]